MIKEMENKIATSNQSADELKEARGEMMRLQQEASEQQERHNQILINQQDQMEELKHQMRLDKENNEKLMIKYKKEVEKGNKEREILQKQVNETKFENPTEYNAVKEKCYKKYLDEIVAKIPNPPKTVKKTFAFVGETSSGKTSTINALFNLNLETSPDANTIGKKMVYNEGDNVTGYSVYDVFGTNDMETYHELQELMSLKSLHYIVFVIGTTFESNSSLYKMLKLLNPSIIVLRNKTEDLDQKDIDQSKTRCRTIFGNVFKLFHIVAHKKKK